MTDSNLHACFLHTIHFFIASRTCVVNDVVNVRNSLLSEQGACCKLETTIKRLLMSKKMKNFYVGTE